MVDWFFKASAKTNQFSDFPNFIIQPIVLCMRNVAIDKLKERFGGLLAIVVNLLAMRDDFSDALIEHPIVSIQSNRLA